MAHHLGLDWKTVKAINQGFLEEEYGQTDYQGFRIQANDEISICKGCRYHMAVLDYLRDEWSGLTTAVRLIPLRNSFQV